MFKKLWPILLVLILVALPLSASGCKMLKPPLGSEKNPIKLYFGPSVEVAVIIESGDAISAFLKQQTGYEFDVKVPTTYAAVVEELGAAEGDAMAFIPAMGYVLAADKYETDVALATVRYGWAYYWAQYVVARDSDIKTLADLDGKIWAYPSTTSTSGYLVPASYFANNGIEPGKMVEAGGHPQAVTAVYEGQADFGTCFFSAPGDTGDWKIGDSPEPEGEWEYTEADGKIKAYKGGQRIRDARTGILSTYKDVLEKVRILDISDPIPNDTVSFCKDFPPEMRDKIVQGLIDYAATEEGLKVLANDEFYDITDFAPVDDSNFDPIRDMIKGLGLTEDDILH
jgi:phosphonate transport system substrate-binding protein